jgi:hypothetical protein
MNICMRAYRTIEPTDSTGKLLNVFQLNGSRHILKLHTTLAVKKNAVFRKHNWQFVLYARGVFETQCFQTAKHTYEGVI